MPDVFPEPLLDTPALSDLLIDLRRHLHRHPEVGFKEYETSAYLRELLAEEGFDVQGPMAETGFYVDIEGAEPGPTVAYRTELDALPMRDAKADAGCPYASTHADTAHLCGHDAHMAVAVGVALLLRERQASLRGTARVLFQPAEEIVPSGAPSMIDAGAIDGVREIFCVHMDPTLDAGRYGLRPGPLTAATAPWTVKVTSGKAGHSARPHETVDTVWLATQILNTFYQLPGRIHDARRTAVLTACRFRAGEALNVIPAEVEIGGTLRCTNFSALHELADKMLAVAEQYGALYDADVDVDIDSRLPPVINDGELVAAVSAIVEEQFGRAVYEIPEPSMGGEDFAFYGQEIPALLVRVGSASDLATRYPLHHTLFDITESVLAPTAQLMAEVIERRLAVRVPANN